MAYALSAVPKLRFTDADGVPLSDGRLYTRMSGVATPLASYADGLGDKTNPNPVPLDVRGEASVYLSDDTYRFVLVTSAGDTVWTRDGIPGDFSSTLPAISPPPRLAFVDDNGAPLVGGKLYVYASGASVLELTTYADADGDVENDNPIVLDEFGQADVFLDGYFYRFELHDADDNLLWIVDRVVGIAGATKYAAPMPRLQFVDRDGAPLAGGKLYTYDSGTTTPAPTYSDYDGTLNDNPVVLNAAGVADIWLPADTPYKYVLKDAVDNTIWTVDRVIGHTFGEAEDAPIPVEHDYWTFWNAFRLLASTGTADTGPGGRTPTYNGGMGTSATQSKFGGVSFYFDGTNDFISFPDNSFYEPGLFALTFEAWIYPTRLSGTQVIFGKRVNSSSSAAILLQLSGSSYAIKANSSGALTTVGTATLNTWQHVRLVRSVVRNRLEFYLNGVLGGTFSIGGLTDIANNAGLYRIGADSTTNFYQGYMDDISFTLAEWVTGNFAVPVFPSLDHQPNITPSGSISALSPSSVTNSGGAANDDAVVGFTSLVLPIELSEATFTSLLTLSSDWTFEAWVVHDGQDHSPWYNALFGMVRTGDGSGGNPNQDCGITLATDGSAITCSFASNGVTYGGTPTSTGITLARFDAYHVAMCYVASSNNFKAFVNGTKLVDFNAAVAMATSNHQAYLGHGVTAKGFLGFIVGWEFTNGTAKYSSDFTP